MWQSKKEIQRNIVIRKNKNHSKIQTITTLLTEWKIKI